MAVEPTHPGKKFADGAIGLSLETEELATRDLSASHQSLVGLMDLLGPGVIRLGGNSLDYSWWTSDSEASPTWATSVITPSDLAALHTLLVTTDWHAILGVDLGHFDPARAADEARAAKRILGSRLLGFEIGNEPNGYGDPRVKLRPSSHNVQNYLKELAAYSAAIRGPVPQMKLYGPDLSLQTWLPAIASDQGASFTAITQHYYPTSYSTSKGACEGTPIPTALELLSPEVREQENVALKTLVQIGETAHRKTRISETNTTGSCDAEGGPATSPVFASALWSLDWILRAASAGVSGLNFHGHLGDCGPDTVSPICAPNYAAEARGQVIARPEYYGLLAARQLEGGRFVPVDLIGQHAGNDLTAYATMHPHGIVTVAIDNLAAKGSATLLLKVPGYGNATGERLLGHSLSATRNVTFGHASVDAGGALHSTATTLPQVGHMFRLELAPASAIVITAHRAVRR